MPHTQRHSKTCLATWQGVYVYGLLLDGCAWSNKEGRLVDSEPKKLFHPLPVLHVTVVQVSSGPIIIKVALLLKL